MVRTLRRVRTDRKMDHRSRTTGGVREETWLVGRALSLARLTWLYGVWPCKTHTLEDQLGLAPGTKSKIEDGSTVGTSVTLRTAVADFR